MNSNAPHSVSGSSPTNACTYVCKYVNQKCSAAILTPEMSLRNSLHTGDKARGWVYSSTWIPYTLDILLSQVPYPQIPYPWIPYQPRIPYHGNQRYLTPPPERTWDQGPGWDLVQKMTSSHCEQKNISFLQLLLWVVKIKLPKIMSHCNTNFCIYFQLALISTWNQCHGQRKCHIVQENLRPVIRTVYESL